MSRPSMRYAVETGPAVAPPLAELPTPCGAAEPGIAGVEPAGLVPPDDACFRKSQPDWVRARATTRPAAQTGRAHARRLVIVVPPDVRGPVRAHQPAGRAFQRRLTGVSPTALVRSAELS